MNEKYDFYITSTEYFRDQLGRIIGKMECEVEHVFYDQDGDLLSWSLWSTTCNDFVPQNLNALKMTYPSKYEELLNLISFENEKRIEGDKQNSIDNEIKKYKEGS